jgi:hypothetical protein
MYDFLTFNIALPVTGHNMLQHMFPLIIYSDIYVMIFLPSILRCRWLAITCCNTCFRLVFTAPSMYDFLTFNIALPVAGHHMLQHMFPLPGAIAADSAPPPLQL